jgi:hypothetical protein
MVDRGCEKIQDDSIILKFVYGFGINYCELFESLYGKGFVEIMLLITCYDRLDRTCVISIAISLPLCIAFPHVLYSCDTAPISNQLLINLLVRGYCI